jgi:hypothetical protein
MGDYFWLAPMPWPDFPQADPNYEFCSKSRNYGIPLRENRLHFVASCSTVLQGEQGWIDR